MIKAIIFDMDGVLVNSEKLKAKAWKKALLDYGIEDGDKWYKRNIGNSRDALSALAIKEFNLTSAQVDEISEKKRNNYFKMLKEATVPIKSSIQFLKSIPKDKFKIAVNSSINTWVIESQMTNLGVIDYFDKITSGKDEVAKDKPHPEIYLLSAKKLGLDPSECLAIEDSKAGVQAAKDAGMKCIGFRNPNSGNQDLSRADIIVDDLNKLYIQKIISL